MTHHHLQTARPLFLLALFAVLLWLLQACGLPDTTNGTATDAAGKDSDGRIDQRTTPDQHRSDQRQRDRRVPDTATKDNGTPDPLLDVGLSERAQEKTAVDQPTADQGCHPKTEICNGKDDDCDGTIDEGCGQVTPPSLSSIVATYTKNQQDLRFYDTLGLSNGTLLVVGQAKGMAWIPKGTKITKLSAGAINSKDDTHIGFIAQLKGDLSGFLHIVHFPKGSVSDVFRIRSTNIPGQVTGMLYVSGSRKVSNYKDDGYYIAKLNNNFVKGVPTATSWIYNARAKPRRASGFKGSSAYKSIQPWDVGNDGRVVFGEGAEYDYDWAAIYQLSPQGKRQVVEHWPIHSAPGVEWLAKPASTYPNAKTKPLEHSAIVLKAGRHGSLRSHSQVDFARTGPDGNGRSDRKGTWPDDYFFKGPCDPSTKKCAGGPGYTGYRTSKKTTQRLGSIVLDRRNNDLYFGYSTQSVLPGGNPDFEPAVVAMSAVGKLRWWSRLYHEQIEKKDGSGLHKTSTPDQYVDGLALDYKANQLVVLARCHGNNVINFWSGNTIKANPNTQGFQNRFTGTNGNIHISWLGKFSTRQGQLQHSTFVAEYAEGTKKLGKAHPDPLLDGWPNPNVGWPNVNTTRCRPGIRVDAKSRVYVMCTGRRTITTRNAYQKMPKPSEGKSGWNDFVRVYKADLNGLVYSSIVRAPWQSKLQDGGPLGVRLWGMWPSPQGVYIFGHHLLDPRTNKALGAPAPTKQRPSWGSATPKGESGFTAHFTF